MARPNKKGLDYFPFDIDFFDDEKIEAISGEFGIKGEITAIKLLCAIYRNGYFILWNDMLKMKLIKNLPGVSYELLDDIIDRLVKWDFFDKNLFDSMKILTSRGIQNRFFSIVKRRSKSDEYPYLIINVCNNGVNVYNNHQQRTLLYTKTTQRKEKESKETIPLISPFSDDSFLTIEKLKTYVFDNETVWYEGIAMKIHLSKVEISDWLNAFFDELVMTGEANKSVKDFKSHFYRWLKIKIDKQKKEIKNEKSVDTNVY